MSNVDLSQLAVERGSHAPPKAKGRKSGWLSRYLLPLFLVTAFSGLLAWAARESLLPSTPVTVVPVMISKAEVHQANTPLFQAAGWVEPRPVPVVLSSLAEGVIEELNVIAGQSVSKGEVVARLIDADAQIALADAQAELRLREAEITAARGELENATTALERPVQLQADLARADSALSALEAELNGFPAAFQAAQIQQVLADENLANKQQAGDAVAGRVLREAKAQRAEIVATFQSLQARQPVLVRQQEALTRMRNALAEKLELKLEEKRRVVDAHAQLDRAVAQRDRAQSVVDTAELRMQRMTIASPINGRVLSVHTSPGQRVNGINPHSEQGSSAVVTLYDPKMLQVRVDVRLEDVPQVQLGQQALIETASVSTGLRGEVISVTSIADIQKNTLQVKVAVVNPPDMIRPEMLAQVTFLAPEQAGSPDKESEDRLRLLVPRQLVDDSSGSPMVWTADRTTNTARRLSVTLGRAGTEDLIEIASGLTPTDKLISSGRDGLVEGQRIAIASEDKSLGIAGSNFASTATPARTAARPESTRTE